MLLSPQGRKPSEFQSIAKQLGRSLCSRGKEPNYVRIEPPVFTTPLSIPNHKPSLKPGTARSIINALMNDVDTWEIYLNEQDDNDE